jgi:hypothetical protein
LKIELNSSSPKFNDERAKALALYKHLKRVQGRQWLGGERCQKFEAEAFQQKDESIQLKGRIRLSGQSREPVMAETSRER